MIKGTTRPIEIPKEMRAVAEQGVEQAKLAFDNYRFFDVSSGLEQVSQARGDHVDHGREGCDVAISAQHGCAHRMIATSRSD